MKRSLWPYVLGGLLLLALLAFLYLVRSVAVPFLLALVLAYFLDPAADYLERHRLSRGLSVAVVFVGFALIAGGVLAFLVPAVEEELNQIQESAPRYAENLYRLIPQPVLDWLGIAADEDLQSMLNRLVAGFRSLSFEVLNQLAVFLSRAFSSTFGFLLAVLGYFIIPIYLFYLLRDFDRIKEGVLRLTPPRHRDPLRVLAREIDGVLSGFIRGQLTVCLVLGVLYSVGLILIGIDLALLIGLLSGLAFIIPYLGTLFGIVTAGIMAAVKFHDLLHPMLVIGWFALIQGLEGSVVTPKIVGNRVGLHPLATILAVMIGGELFGFLGLLLAVPVAASGKVLLLRALELYRESGFFNRDEKREGSC